MQTTPSCTSNPNSRLWLLPTVHFSILPILQFVVDNSDAVEFPRSQPLREFTPEMYNVHAFLCAARIELVLLTVPPWG